MNSTEFPDASFYTPDVFIYSPYNAPAQPASLTRQIPKKLIPDEYIDLSFLQSLPPIPLTEDQGVIKYLMQKGEPLLPHQEIPKIGAIFHVKYEGRKLDGQLLDKFRDRNEVRKVKLGKNSYIDGITIALPTMKRKEIAWFRFEAKYHYYAGDMNEMRTTCDGEPMVMPNEVIYYKLEVVDYKNLEKLENDDFEGRINKMEEIRLKGKEIFQKGDFVIAYKNYVKGIGIAKSFPKILMETVVEEQMGRFKFYHTIMHSNAILCKIKEKKWYEALRLCEDGLNVNEKDVKLLFLKGQCNLNISNYELAFDCFNAVLNLDPENKEAKKIIEFARKKEKNEDFNEKQRFRKVFEQWDQEEKQEFDEMRYKMKKKRIEDQQNGKKEVNIEIEKKEEDYEEEEDDETEQIPLESLMKGMVIDTNKPDNMFNQIKSIDLEDSDEK